MRTKMHFGKVGKAWVHRWLGLATALVLALVLALALVLLLASCEGAAEASPKGKPLVVATTGMVADLARNIGGDSVEVKALMGPGVDPHLYKATQGDLQRLQQADLILYNGLHLEGKMGEVLEKLARLKSVVAVARSIDSTRLLQDPVYASAYDPHIWFDVSLWAQATEAVSEALVAVDPEGRAYYEANAAGYRQDLLKLHEWVREAVQEIPAERRILITAHDAFNYFGEAYGVEVRGLQGISTLSEFGLKDRVDLVNFLVERQIKAVFVETSVSKKNINSIVEGCRQRGHEIVIGGNLYSDAMGEPGTEEGTYEGMVRANVTTVVASLK